MGQHYLPRSVLSENWNLGSLCYTKNFFATESISFLILPFVQLKWQRKMAARFFLYDNHLAKVVLSGTCFLRRFCITECSLIHRMFLDNVHC